MWIMPSLTAIGQTIMAFAIAIMAVVIVFSFFIYFSRD